MRVEGISVTMNAGSENEYTKTLEVKKLRVKHATYIIDQVIAIQRDEEKLLIQAVRDLFFDMSGFVTNFNEDELGEFDFDQIGEIMVAVKTVNASFFRADIS